MAEQVSAEEREDWRKEIAARHSNMEPEARLLHDLDAAEQRIEELEAAYRATTHEGCPIRWAPCIRCGEAWPHPCGLSDSPLCGRCRRKTAQRLRKAEREVERLAEALAVYSKEAYWSKDDWGVDAVFYGPDSADYGEPWARATAALAALQPKEGQP